MRPRLDVAVRRNGDSLKVYELGVYIGSYSIRKLVALVAAENAKRPSTESTQLSAEQSGTENHGNRPNCADDVEGVLP